MSTLFAVAMLVGMFAVGIGFWALGQWLRSRGHGDLLDKIDAKLSKGQRSIGRFIGQLVGGFGGVARSISCVNFLGNRHSRDMWDDIEEQERQRRKDRT